MDPPRSVTNTALLYIYIYYVATSQETHLCASTACYGDSFIFICSWCSYLIGNIWVSTACYREALLFFTQYYYLTNSCCCFLNTMNASVHMCICETLFTIRPECPAVVCSWGCQFVWIFIHFGCYNATGISVPAAPGTATLVYQIRNVILSQATGLWWVTLSLKNGVFWVVTPCGSCKNRRISSQRTSVASCSLCWS
jgi:hypothetical protein